MADFSKDKLRNLLENGLGRERFSNQIQNAFELAYRGHRGQYRDRSNAKEAPVPYIVHPIGVALIASELAPLEPIDDCFDDLISACLAHDLLEDSDVTRQDLQRATSQRTAEIVSALTKPLVPNDASRQQRNDRFIHQIIASGRTAAFVKVCDYLHNISRPQNAPLKLLNKSIQKGRSSYLRLFEAALLSASLRNEYLRRLEIADAFRSQVSDTAKEAVASLSEAIDFCVNTAERKVLEVHDILDALQTVSGASSIVLLTNEQFVHSLMPDVSDASSARSKARILSQIRGGKLDRSQLPKEVLENQSSRFGTIFSLDIGLGDEGTDGLRAILNLPENESEWLTLNNLRVIASYLSQRHKMMERNRMRDLAAGLAELQIDVDPADLFVLNLTYTDLVKLKRVTDVSEHVRNVLHSGVAFRFGTGAHIAGSPQIVSRVKSPRSILRKMKARRRYSHFNDIEDLVGIRIVCESAHAAQKLSDELRDFLPSSISPGGDLGIDAKIAIANIGSLSGYRAIHVTAVASPASEPDFRVGCEVQVRSVFQDAWARISQEVSYKKNRSDQRRTKESLKKLADLRDIADRIVDELS